MRIKSNFTKGQFFILILCLFISIRAFYTLITDSEIIYDSASWVSSEARVLESQVGKSWSKLPSDGYTAEITYQYVVDGKEYINDRVTVPNQSMTKYLAHAMVEGFSKGVEVNIWYDADSPQRSVIVKPSFGWWFIISHGLGCALFFWAFIWLFHNLRKQ